MAQRFDTEVDIYQIPFVEVDECQPNPCKNDGVCTNNPTGGFSCNCKEGYRGLTCIGKNY